MKNMQDDVIYNAHKRAIRAREQHREDVLAQFKPDIDRAIQRGYDRINEGVAAVIRERLAEGVTRGEVRKSLRSNDKKTWRQYFDFIDSEKDRPGPGRPPKSKTEPEVKIEEISFPNGWFAPDHTLVKAGGRVRFDFYNGKLYSEEDSWGMEPKNGKIQDLRYVLKNRRIGWDEETDQEVPREEEGYQIGTRFQVPEGEEPTDEEIAKAIETYGEWGRPGGPDNRAYAMLGIPENPPAEQIEAGF